jgi:phosphoadenosine phosphosulfate reductase
MDEQLYLMAVGLSLEEKVEKAIEYFRTFEHEALKRDPVNGYYLCDSYGKDSCTILELAKMSGVKFKAHHNLTTLDPPELVMFGRKHHSDTVVHKPEINMLKRMETSFQGPPTRLNRWCCAEYKEGAGLDKIRVFGVRAAESARRKAQWRVWTPDRKSESFILNPILFWTDEDVWRFIKLNRVPYCSLYDNGFSRLGCIGCPMSNRDETFKKHPKHKAAWMRSMKKMWERLHDKPCRDGSPRYWARFDTPEAMWDWWMEENQPEAEDDCQMGLF